jgi:ABC-type hemin transport system ATPase subunit
VIEAESLAKGFDGKLLIDGLSFKLPPGGIVGVIGPNGAGKTTLFRMLTGHEKPDDGAIRLGEQPCSAMSTRTDAGAQQERLGEISGGAEVITLASARSRRAPMSARSIQGLGPAEAGLKLSGGSATVSIWPRC